MANEPTNPLERRKSIRGKIVFPFKHGKIESGKVGHLIDAKTKDLSTGGLSFISPIAYQLQESIHLEITPPGWHKKEIIEGKICRCQPIDNNQFIIGVQFITIDKGFQDSLGEYVY